MIDTIEVENFQSHKNTSISLSPGVNVIKGRSHSGKSSIVRAIRWDLLNQPRGAHFVSHFKGKKDTTSVGISFNDEGYVVREKRGTTVNGYDTPIGKLAAIRSGVPEEVQQITQMGEINIQTQGDPYFMLSKTAGQVAKELNKLVGLDIIDDTLGKLNRIENEAGGKLKVLEEVVEKEVKELSNLSFVNDLNHRVVEIETLWKEYNKLLAEKSALSDMVKKVGELDSDIKDTNEWLTIKEPYQEIIKLVEERQALLKSYTQLEKLIVDMKYTQKVWQIADRVVVQLTERKNQILNSDDYKQSFCRWCGAHKSHWRKG